MRYYQTDSRPRHVSEAIYPSTINVEDLIALPIELGISLTRAGLKLLGKRASIIAAEDAAKTGSTVANRLGQQMHKAYKAGDVLDGVRIKEFMLPSRKRIDFIDLEKKIIYELKPNNPRAIKQGYKQLEMYKQEVESIYGKGFKTILDTY
ncbi:Restriction endonuclease fold toxin 9 [Arachidicoccus rhizosphaerae]|uniref:Restriction endonuclease fold toxin 9 n=1 Tax=Arachidicoccus rhizosphaerae TaxID=551991 RepID=A0A1H4D5M5_9BACT|nr:Restriction endonuclease fold toxin 9 [Arachidicoccus rhizosphaerae]